ncbi:MAG: histidine phosphatase family protein [Alphaproteobacteria bacterium]|nr:histidine phosphatase family protein [Alphaproteobacteria bacterium]
MIPSKAFYMIRHGETEANAARIMAGSMDTPLTEKGRLQAKDVQRVVENLEIKPQTLVHSHLSRARDTARIINEVLGAPMYENPDLGEFHAGEWEGVPYEECNRIFYGWETPPGGETPDEFTNRIQRGKSHSLESYDGPVLIVCHGGVFRGFGRIYGLDVPGVFKNCHLYEFQPDPDNSVFPWRVWSYGFDQEDFREESSVFRDAIQAKACA